MRPRRKRKLTNYGEGHLHWIEESQLQKALIKSLREKNIKDQLDEVNEDEINKDNSKETPSTSKLPRVSVSLETDVKDLCITSIAGVSLTSFNTCRYKNNSQVVFNESQSSGRTLRSKIKKTGPSLEEMSHAAMMQSQKSDSKDSKTLTWSKDMEKESISVEKSSSPVQNLKTRAQRKFASNSPPPPNVRHSTRAEKKQKKSSRHEEDRFEPIPDDPLPESSHFINYLCFRNTPYHFELEDDDDD